MSVQKFKYIFLIGAGGIGMSALARYFVAAGFQVAGYDRSRSPITRELEAAGVEMIYDESAEAIPATFKKAPKEEVLVIYTPAVPTGHGALTWFKKEKYEVQKRAVVLGWLTGEKFTVAIAGTHGKTTTTTLTAHILKNAGKGCSAFLGGISVNYNTNFISDPESQNVVVEADEFDRSFLQLYPDIAVVTSMDADHLDIYGSADEVKRSFVDFIDHVSGGGMLLIHEKLRNDVSPLRKLHFYGTDPASDFYAKNILVKHGRFHFDLHAPQGVIKDISFGIPGRHNVENATAAAAAALMMDIPAEKVKAGLESFLGVRRRFEFHVRNDRHVYIDDYAHHPAELKACIGGVRELLPGKKITGIFQPHLYSRTRDFADEFAQSLSMLDECILLEIYPAREEPLPGITSSLLIDKMSHSNARVLTKEEVIEFVRKSKPELLLTMGAGDIDQLIEPIKNIFAA